MPVSSFIYGIDENHDIWEVEFSDTNFVTASTLRSAGPNTNNSLGWCEHHGRLYWVNAQQEFQYWLRDTDQIVDVTGINPGVSIEPGNGSYWAESFWWISWNSNILNEAQINYEGSSPHASVGKCTNLNSWAIRGMDLPASPGNNTNTFGDIAIDNNGILYASTSRGRFYKIDLSDPEESFEEISPSLGNTTDLGLQLCFSSDYSILYGQSHDPGLNTSAWHTVDLTNGTRTEIYSSPTLHLRDLSGASSSTSAYA